jgi:hypothetical protein
LLLDHRPTGGVLCRRRLCATVAYLSEKGPDRRISLRKGPDRRISLRERARRRASGQLADTEIRDCAPLPRRCTLGQTNLVELDAPIKSPVGFCWLRLFPA